MKQAVREAPNIKVIRATYDPIKDWRMDPAGYFLIRINPETKELEVGFCKKNNIIELKVHGRTAEEVYNTVLREVNLTQTHAAYLGKELEKAEIARNLKIKYVQDEPLDLKQLIRMEGKNDY